MSVTIAKENYPGFTQDATVSGKRIATFLNYGTGASATNPVWNELGGVTSNALNLSANVSTVQTKENGYWGKSGITSKSLEYTADMVLTRDNVAQMAIDEFMYNDEITAEKGALEIANVDLDTLEYTKMRIVPTAWGMTAASEDSVQYSLSATVTGQPERCTGFVLPEA